MTKTLSLILLWLSMVLVSPAMTGAHLTSVSSHTTGSIVRDNSKNHPAIIQFKPDPEVSEVPKCDCEGTIILRAIFTSDKRVTDITFKGARPKSLPKATVKMLAKRCVDAARRIKFEPATRDGRPVSMYVQLEYNFRLFDDESKGDSLKN